MPSITYRKLIKFGDDGLVITIPIGWIRYNGLKPGDKLQVVTNGELTIFPLSKKANETEQSSQTEK